MSTMDVAAACLAVLRDSVMIFSVSFVLTGVVVGVLQTVFSIQDQGLPLTMKLVVLLFLLTTYGGDVYGRFHLLFRSL